MNHFAVMGNPIEHSLSPAIHQYFARQTGISLRYEKILAGVDTFEQQVSNFFHAGGKGLNITAPFKERAFKMANMHTQRCTISGSANSLWMQNGQIHADSTDGVGLINDISKHTSISKSHILLIGAGGAGRAVIPSLLDALPRTLTLVNRTMEKAALLKTEFPEIQLKPFADIDEPIDIIIHATSAAFNHQMLQLKDTWFHNTPFCYDLTYDMKKPTPFVQFSREKGCRSIDGLGMLIAQAAFAFEIWHSLYDGET